MQPAGAAMDDPDVIEFVDPDADGPAQQPVVGQRLRPQRIDFVHRGLHGRALGLGVLLQHGLADTEAENARGERRAAEKSTLAQQLDHDASLCLSLFLGTIIAESNALEMRKFTGRGRIRPVRGMASRLTAPGRVGKPAARYGYGRGHVRGTGGGRRNRPNIGACFLVGDAIAERVARRGKSPSSCRESRACVVSNVLR